jgi:UDP-N-acetylmuramate dehydrogenase
VTVSSFDVRATARHDEPLARHTTFRIGGPADLFLVAESEAELAAAARWAGREGVDLLVLGAGSNILVADEGVRGLVLVNRASTLQWPDLGTDEPGREFAGHPTKARVPLRAASGVPLSSLARQAARRGLGGLEWAVGIPGTLGGAIVQNAGAYGGCMADIAREATVLDNEGVVRSLDSSALAFGYRASRFRDRSGESRELILNVDLTLQPQAYGDLRSRMSEYIARRRATQPRLPSAGSVFRNPPGDHAGRLIEAAGLKGMREGDAMVAPEHANFIVNVGSARAMDAKALIDRIRTRVAHAFGVELELEIQLVGDWHVNCN